MTLCKFITETSELSNISKIEAQFALNYLQYYYVAPEKKKFIIGDVKTTIKIFQKRAGLTINGKLDGLTLKAMRWPRCGCKDNAPAKVINLGIRALHNAPKWKLLNLTYFVDKYIKGISRSDQDSLIELAFQQWEDNCQLNIVRTMSKRSANMVVSSGQGKRNNFDGPGNTLAWAYLPPKSNYNGQLQMKFDIDETWIQNVKDRGILFLNVAAHEFGHFLGLEHSRARRSLMAPFYNPVISKPQQNDDIIRIQRLYGKPKTAPKSPVPKPKSPVPKPKSPVPKPSDNKIEISGIKNLNQIKINGKSL